MGNIWNHFPQLRIHIHELHLITSILPHEKILCRHCFAPCKLFSDLGHFLLSPLRTLIFFKIRRLSRDHGLTTPAYISLSISHSPREFSRTWSAQHVSRGVRLQTIQAFVSMHFEIWVIPRCCTQTTHSRAHGFLQLFFDERNVLAGCAIALKAKSVHDLTPTALQSSGYSIAAEFAVAYGNFILLLDGYYSLQ